MNSSGPTTCHACGSTRPLIERIPSVRDPQSTEHFAIRACPDCGVGITSPVPEDLGKYYGPLYYGGRHSFTADYCTARRVRLLTQHAPRPGNLLDIGCGDGSFLLGARKAGWAVSGTEIGGAAELSKATGLTVHDSLESVDNGRFDVVTMWHTLEHFRDPFATVDSARKKLAPGGLFIVAVPDANGLQAALFGKSWFHFDVPRHLFHFDRSSLSTMMKRASFSVSEWHHMEIELDIFGWMQSALNRVMPEPNVLFQSLTGKPRMASRGQLAASYVLGTALGPAAVAATALGGAMGRSATLIAIARPV